MKPLNELTACEAATAIADSAISSESLTRACLERIEAREPEVQAWEFLDPELALEQAKRRDAGALRGPLHGLPFGVKDIIDTYDMPTAYGSPIYQGHRPSRDASCVAMIRTMGAIIMGKTVTTEFAFFQPGKTRNPHNPAHTPGGSSSGSAAAVADCMIPLAYGTQTGGSVIRPASFCGVVGYKSSRDSFDLSRIKPLAFTLDTLGTFSRSVEDACLVRAALLDAPAHPHALDGPPRIGLCRTYEWDQADPVMQQAVEDAATALRDAGAEVDEIDLPTPFERSVEAHRTVMTFDAARALPFEWARHSTKLSQHIYDLIADGLAMVHADYEAAIAVRDDCRRYWYDLMHEYDALLMPSAAGEAPAGLETTGDPLFNRMTTLLGVPCVSLPGHVGPNGLPLGVQAVGAMGGDDKLLSVAAWMQSRIV